MKSHIARIPSYAVCWIVALTASALAAEKNPPGDIPDDQVFVPYASVAGGYSLKVPEGWARSEKGSDVGFIDKFDGVAVIVDKVATAPATKDIVAKLEKTERGFKAVSAKEIRLPAGPALLIKYESESEANSVTNKRIRLEDEAYVFRPLHERLVPYSVIEYAYGIRQKAAATCARVTHRTVKH